MLYAHRQENGENRALARCALDPDLTVMKLYHLPADRQTDSRALGRSPGFVPVAIKIFKEMRQGFLRDARSGISHRNPDRGLFLAGERSRQRHLDLAAAGGVFQGIVDQVDDHPLHLAGVEPGDERTAGGRVTRHLRQREPDPAAPRQRFKSGDDVL